MRVPLRIILDIILDRYIYNIIIMKKTGNNEIYYIDNIFVSVKTKRYTLSNTLGVFWVNKEILLLIWLVVIDIPR